MILRFKLSKKQTRFILYRLHGGHQVDCRNFHSILQLLHIYIARQHGSDFVFSQKWFVANGWVADT